MTTRAFVTGLLTPPAVPVVKNVARVKVVAPLAAEYVPVIEGDAPNDGLTYGRRGGLWVDVTSGAGLPEAPSDGKAYLRGDGAWHSGGTLTQPLILSGPPVASLEAATKAYVDTADADKVAKLGDTMTGPLILFANPSVALEAAPKQYVDARVAKAGDTMTGPLVLNADPSVTLGAATKGYVDTKAGNYVPIAGGVMTGLLTLSGNPSTANQAATKTYVDNATLDMGTF